MPSWQGVGVEERNLGFHDISVVPPLLTLPESACIPDSIVLRE